MNLSNRTFSMVSSNHYQSIKKFINQRYRASQKIAVDYVTDTFEIGRENEKITFTLYKTNKLVVQSSPTNIDFINIVKEISNILSDKLENQEQQTTAPLLEENKRDFNYYIGCDEAGRGETFGSLFLGCALINKENFKKINYVLQNKNIRKLNKNNVKQLISQLRAKYDFLYKEYSAREIDKYSLNMLLDTGYKQLLSEIIDNKKNLMIAIDDYGIGSKLKDYIKKIENDDIKVIVKHKADEEFTACKIASLGARDLRINQIEKLDKEFELIDNCTREKIYPGAGSASNENTNKYLKTFKKQNPTLDYPFFVRQKWKNIKTMT